MNDSALGDTSTDERGGLAFRPKNGWHRITAPFTDDDYDLPFSILIAGISAVAAGVFFFFLFFYNPQKNPPHFYPPSPSPPSTPPPFLSPCFPRFLARRV